MNSTKIFLFGIYKLKIIPYPAQLVLGPLSNSCDINHFSKPFTSNYSSKITKLGSQLVTENHLVPLNPF